MGPILHDTLPVMPPRRGLPGMQPLDPADWLQCDAVFAAQMAARDALIAQRPAAVHAVAARAVPAAGEALDLVLTHLRAMPGYGVGQEVVTRPDGVAVGLDRDAPLVTLGRLIQADICLLQADGSGAHVLTGAILCFPAHWCLHEKMGRALIGIHRPVRAYDADIARRVQRLFDALRPERPLWRANALGFADPALHQPLREDAPRPPVPVPAPFIRVERQCLLRLPRSGVVVFSIHTHVARRENLTPAQAAALTEAG